ncbi:hypothetical protein HYE15_00890 [Mycoplasmopsis bovis]|nr:hypothetical protein [Mycoplasmopsis bovis]QQH25504.1 hypothetical protein HYE15_00890 [Mycoplasmopsis bovis]
MFKVYNEGKVIENLKMNNCLRSNSALTLTQTIQLTLNTIDKGLSHVYIKEKMGVFMSKK